ncbi:MAG: metal ABC transporter permease, partial [Desulfurobacteriaceae bacterium]
MLHNPFDYLQYDFGVKGVLSALLAGITCSALGTSIVLRKMAFAGAGISHVAFAGVALGFLLGISPIFSALLLSLLVSVVLWYLQVKKGLHFDVTMGVLFSASMGLAVIALSLSGAYGSQALSYLFGSPLLVSGID